MPHKDPLTGCMVTTTAELLAEDESFGDILQDVFDDLEADCERERVRLRDPLNAIDFLVKAVDEENDALRQVLEVLEVEYYATFRETKERVKARVRVDTGEERVLAVQSWRSHGSMWEPPDGDTEIDWDGT